MALCQCQLAKREEKALEKSGLKGLLESRSFDTFHANEPWQQAMVQKAHEYTREIIQGKESWFFIGGQVGCGKTHICTAICRVLLYNHLPVKYMVWPEEAARIKGYSLEPDKKEALLEPLGTTKVLYVDDFLKKPAGVRGGSPSVTEADLKLAFDLFNRRYNRQLPTVISCEWSLEDLLQLDEAVGSRIYEMTRGYRLMIGHDKKKNWRMRDGG